MVVSNTYLSKGSGAFMNQQEYQNKVYAGVLGKLIGVFFGRPIEGWPYEKIRDRFDVVDYYVYKEAGTPLIVADDDLAGTFTFFNAIEDAKDIKKLTAYDFGETWLNYVIENKTIFWWGGLGRSTEHTAFLRLKEGHTAPYSGSIQLNGSAIAEQIGAQIFIDAFAMMCPGDPEMARFLIEKAASVSHDGIAVESASFIGSMQANAFKIRDIDELLSSSLNKKASDRIKRIIDDVGNICQKSDDWRYVRDWLDVNYGYQLYPGNCHVIPNLALILASLVLGGDSFKKSMEIVVSSGWDTDCNGANLGCLNGIRLGLDSINAEFDYRTPIADRFYNISSEGGNCVTDAVIQTRRIIRQKERLYGEEDSQKASKRFEFEYPGSVQGFVSCPHLGSDKTTIINANTMGNAIGNENGIVLEGTKEGAYTSTPVMWDPKDRQDNYCLIGSPTLYSGQTVQAKVSKLSGSPEVRLYVVHYDFDDNIIIKYSDRFTVIDTKTIEWEIPDTKGMTISRIGIECRSKEDYTSSIILKSLDWTGAPKKYEIKGSLRNYDLGTFNMTMNSFVSSAKQFSFDSRASFTVSHPEKNGVVTIGTEQWDDYSIESTLEPSIHNRYGILLRARGHRKYYAAVFSDGNKVNIIRKNGSDEEVLASGVYEYKENEKYNVLFRCKENTLELYIDKELILSVKDSEYSHGGAGFIVDCGTVLAYDLIVKSCKD